MDVAIRTPHGDADVAIVRAPVDTTLGELIETVTGQAPPGVARIDGTTTAVARLLDELPIAIGSVIDTGPITAEPDGEPVAVVELTQLTGYGAGRTRALAPGTYRVGAARHRVDHEIADGDVAVGAFDLMVASDGSVRVALPPTTDSSKDRGDVRIDGVMVSAMQPWTTGILEACGRHFVHGRPVTRQRTRPEPRASGEIVFDRLAALPAGSRRPAVGAIADARSANGRLWSWRGASPGAFHLGYGVPPSHDSVATVDFARHPATAVVGHRWVAAALARTLLIEACTMHGPSTLDVVIVSDEERSANWNWASWLPHVRSGSPTRPPRILTDTSSVEAWAEAQRTRPSTDSTRTTLLLVDVDTPNTWWRGDGPLTRVVRQPPEDLRLLLVADDVAQVPPVCSVMLEHGSPRRPPADDEIAEPTIVQHVRSDATIHITDISPALLEIDVAHRVALDLAPFVDIDLAGTAGAPDRTDLAEVVEVFRSGSTVITGPRPQRDRLVVSLVLDATSDIEPRLDVRDDSGTHRIVPEDVAVVVVSLRRPGWFDAVAPRAVWVPADDRDAGRVITRVGQVAHDRADLDILVVFDQAFDPGVSSLLTELLELESSRSNVHLVLAGDDADAVPARARSTCSALITGDGEGTGTITLRSGPSCSVAVPQENDVGRRIASGRTNELVVLPRAPGRAFTPLERRLSRAATERSAMRNGGHVALFRPPSLPPDVDATELLSDYQGDGVPIGLLDDPARSEYGAYWWQPGTSGSLLAVGSETTGMDRVLDLVCVGLASRFSADDIHVIAITSSPMRQHALGSLPHTAHVINARNGGGAANIIGYVHETMRRRLDARPAAFPGLVVLIDGIGALLDALPGSDVPFLDLVTDLINDGGRVGISVVVSAVDGNHLGAVATAECDRLDALGDGQPTGRCRSIAQGAEVQLATISDDLQTALSGIDAEPASDRPPSSFAQVTE